jgi:methylenetetrahydrofolate dehydrogenase (NADP+)/methenyltetrahydrofolate cyclohydrolase
MAFSNGLVLDGRKASQAILADLKEALAELGGSRPPGLAIVQVGDLAASNTYINQKKKRAEELGIACRHVRLPGQSSFREIRDELVRLGMDHTLDGIILQLPLDTTQSISAEEIHELLETIPPGKDADGLHTMNQGQLMAGCSTAECWAAPLPATALGVLRLLQFYKIPIAGKDVVVLGKSRLVGLPSAILLMQAHATVSVGHSQSRDWSELTRRADIVVVATGRKHLLKPEHVREGVVIIDVGIHRGDDGKLTGDVDPATFAKASAYSPVPGGVGPMTVGSLMENVLHLYRLSLS